MRRNDHWVPCSFFFLPSRECLSRVGFLLPREEQTASKGGECKTALRKLSEKDHSHIGSLPRAASHSLCQMSTLIIAEIEEDECPFTMYCPLFLPSNPVPFQVHLPGGHSPLRHYRLHNMVCHTAL